jgi:hypothetical protein
VGTKQVHAISITRPFYVFNEFGVLYGEFDINLDKKDVFTARQLSRFNSNHIMAPRAVKGKSKPHQEMKTKAVGKAVGTKQVHAISITRPFYVFNEFGVLYVFTARQLSRFNSNHIMAPRAVKGKSKPHQENGRK